MKCFKELSRLKLYLLRQKSTVNETLYFFQIVSLVFRIQYSYSSEISIGWSTSETPPFNVLHIPKSYLWDDFSIAGTKSHIELDLKTMDSDAIA